MRKGRITIFFDGQIFYNQKYGGVSRYHAELFLNMKKRCKVKIPILFSRNTYLDSAKIKRSIRDCKLFFNRYTEILNENYFKLNVKLFKPDIIHLTWIDPYLWDINIPAKKVVTIHDMIHEIFWGDTAKEEIENKKKAIYRSDKIIAISENTKRDILYFYPDIPEEKISVIYHGIDKLLVERKPGNIEIPEKYVLFVGQRGDYKNGMLLLKAMKEMLRKDQMLHLVYIGGGAFKDYERKTIDEYNVELQVHQYNVTDEELAFFYSHAECFVYPSKYEGFGMPVLEAFDKNVPVICSDTSSLPEVAGGAALYFDGESEQQLRDCINLLLSDSNKRKEFIKRGREQKKKFSWEKCAEENDGFFALYRRALVGMYYAMKLGLIPIVEYSKNTMYSEKDMIFDTDNPYEYYFLQPTEYSLSDIGDFQRSIKWENSHVNLARSIGKSGSYSISEEYLLAMAETTERYIKLRPEIEQRLKRDLDSVLCNDDRVLGVHYRGTDFRQGYKDHPIFIEVDDHMQAIDHILEKGNTEYSRIFLATDDERALEKFKNKYGEKVCYYGKTTRGTGNTSVMYSQVTRQNHNFELGYEVLRDMWTLAHCSGLVAGTSQVSICSRIIRRSIGERKYEDEIILDKGVNATGKVFSGK